MITAYWWIFCSFIIVTSWLAIYYKHKYDKLVETIQRIKDPEQQILNAVILLNNTEGYVVIKKIVNESDIIL